MAAGRVRGDALEALLLRLRRRVGARARSCWGFEGHATCMWRP